MSIELINKDHYSIEIERKEDRVNILLVENEAFGERILVGAEEGMVRLFINIGKKQNVKPGDILGAIAGESGMPGRLVGSIDMFDKYTFVEVPRENARDVLNAMDHAKIKGKLISIEPANRK